MNVRIVFIISLAKVKPVIPTFTKKPVIPVSGSLIEISDTTKKVITIIKNKDFLINIIGSFYLSLFFFLLFFCFLFLNLYDESMFV